ncbi:MAG: FecR domain-containing protein [Spirochaetes bacterium]|nr:FecR domain-containing protein [Spirochaetota bacterium]
MKRLFIMLLAMAAAVSLSCKKDAEESFMVQNIIGDVKVSINKAEKTASQGDVLKANDRIITGSKSLADLTLSNSCLVRVSENTSVKISSLIDKIGNETQMDMDKGKLHVTLSKLSKGAFSVKTPTAVASVRGTSFRVSVADDSSRIDVLKGKVSVNPVMKGMVIKDVEKVVESSQTTDITMKKVQEIVNKKAEIKVAVLKPEEISEIKNEFNDIKSDVVEKLEDNAKKEYREEIQKTSGDDKNDKLKEERKKALDKIKEEKAAKEQAERDRLEKEKNEKIMKEKEKRERASNIPTL